MPMAHVANLVLSRTNMQTPAKIWLEIKSMRPKSLQQLQHRVEVKEEGFRSKLVVFFFANIIQFQVLRSVSMSTYRGIN